MLSKIGVLKRKRQGNEGCELLCYVFNEVVGQTEEMLLISLSAIIDARINILYHMNESNKNTCQDKNSGLIKNRSKMSAMTSVRRKRCAK